MKKLLGCICMLALVVHLPCVTTHHDNPPPDIQPTFVNEPEIMLLALEPIEIEIEIEEEIEIEYEYPEAQQIWEYLQELGYNDYVCAGIMGNMMVECGGYSFDLQTDANGGGYWGVCQWSKVYHPDVFGEDLEYQCDYLRDTIKIEIDNFGFCYKKSFNYDSFLELTDSRDAALAFAKCYERCHKAYEYFVGSTI